MTHEVEFSDEFGDWWDELQIAEQASVDAAVTILATFGPALGRPYVDSLKGSKVANMKELRVQHEGRPYRILFAFDPRRTALLLVGGDKTGNARFYEEMLPRAEAIWAEHVSEIKRARKQER